MTIQEMASNFDLLAHGYFYSAIAYIAFLFCCHIIEVFQALKADYRAKFVDKDSEPFQPILKPSRQKVRLAVDRSVSYCSKNELAKALA